MRAAERELMALHPATRVPRLAKLPALVAVADALGPVDLIPD